MDTLTLERPVASAFSPAPRFTINKNIPIPPRSFGGRTGRAPLYPFAQMEVGDSFDVAVDGSRARNGGRPAITALQATISNCARGYAKRHNPGAKFETRQIGKSHIRVWRTA